MQLLQATLKAEELHVQSMTSVRALGLQWTILEGSVNGNKKERVHVIFIYSWHPHKYILYINACSQLHLQAKQLLSIIAAALRCSSACL